MEAGLAFGRKTILVVPKEYLLISVVSINLQRFSRGGIPCPPKENSEADKTAKADFKPPVYNPFSPFNRL